MVVVRVTVRKRPKFRFGVRLVLAGSVQFGKNFAEFLPNFLAFNFMFTYIYHIRV